MRAGIGSGWQWAARGVLALVVLVLALGTAMAQEALKGVALVIGQSDYRGLSPLPNPGNDARALSRLLDDLGFDVERVTDADTVELSEALAQFGRDAETADVALLYYSGHGIEAGGENYLIPIDADTSSPEAVGQTLVPLSGLLAQLQAKVPVTIALLDACRDNPFPHDFAILPRGGNAPLPVGPAGLGLPRGGGAPGGAAVSAPSESLGALIGFAAEPGRVALDGPAGTNSPYAEAILKHMAAGGFAFGDIMTMVTEEVYLKTRGRQLPWTNSSLRRVLNFGLAAEETGSDEARIRSERRQLLLTIADAPETTRRFVETVADAEKVSLDALYGMLGVLEVDTSAGPDQLEQQLLEGARRLKAFMAARGAPVQQDVELVRLTGLADTAEAEGAIALAQEFRAQASARAEELAGELDDREAQLQADRLEIAETFARHAETAILNFDFATAADRYGAAAEQARRWDRKLAIDYAGKSADALQAHGTYKGDNQALEAAIAAYEALLADVGRADEPAKWVEIKTGLGNALWTLGDRQTSDDTLEAAVVQFGDALDVINAKTEPYAFGVVQVSLANVYSSLGRRQSGTELLHQAVAAYRASLDVLGRADYPLDWATTQNNLGQTLFTLGERESGTRSLEEAAHALRLALEENRREVAPLSWGMTQNNLANVLMLLGTRDPQSGNLKAAEEAYRQALLEQTRDKVPLEWAANMSNLGNVLTLRAQAENDPGLLDEALQALELALEEVSPERSATRWAMAHNNIGNIFLARAKATDDAALLDRAIGHYRQALTASTRPDAPFDWALTQNNLGTALMLLGEQERDPKIYAEAARAMSLALQERTRERMPVEWATGQTVLAGVQALLGDMRADVDLLVEARRNIELALEVQSRKDRPYEWALAQITLGNVLAGLGKHTADNQTTLAAAAAYDAGLSELDPLANRLDWGRSAYSLAAALLDLAGRENSPARFKDAWGWLNGALAAYDRQSVPMLWGQAMLNLGFVQLQLGILTSDPAYLDQSVLSYGLSQASFSREADPLLWAQAESSIGTGLYLAATLRGDNQSLVLAQARHEAALAILPSGGPEAANAQFGLGLVLGQRALYEQDLALFDAAQAALDTALASWTPQSAPVQYPVALLLRANAQFEAGRLSGDSQRLEAFLATADQAAEILTPEADPYRFILLLLQYGGATAILGESDPDTARLEQGIDWLNQAIEQLTLFEAGNEAAQGQAMLCRAQLALGQRRADPALVAAGLEQCRSALATAQSLGNLVLAREAQALLDGAEARQF